MPLLHWLTRDDDIKTATHVPYRLLEEDAQLSHGELAAKGEEFECAKLIDTLPQVEFWIRNLASRPQTSFWLPTSTDRFYPDFVAMLNDGRIFAIEYKGAHLADNPDTLEKTNVGQLWAAKSQGKALFLMAEQKDAQGHGLAEQIVRAIG